MRMEFLVRVHISQTRIGPLPHSVKAETLPPGSRVHRLRGDVSPGEIESNQTCDGPLPREHGTAALLTSSVPSGFWQVLCSACRKMQQELQRGRDLLLSRLHQALQLLDVTFGPPKKGSPNASAMLKKGEGPISRCSFASFTEVLNQSLRPAGKRRSLDFPSLPGLWFAVAFRASRVSS